MSNKKPVIVGGINLTTRFNKRNLQFISRFVLSVSVPILAYFGLSMDELTSWKLLGNVFLQAISNPYLVGLSIINGINVIFDSTHSQLTDTKKVLERTNPNVVQVQSQDVVKEESNVLTEESHPVDEQYQYNKPEEENEQTVDTTDEYQAPEDKVFPTAEELENNLEDNSDDFKDISFKK